METSYGITDSVEFIFFIVACKDTLSRENYAGVVSPFSPAL